MTNERPATHHALTLTPAPKQRRNRIAAAAKRAEAEAKGLTLRAIQLQHKAKAETEAAQRDYIPAPTPSQTILSPEDFAKLPEPEQQMITAWQVWDYCRKTWDGLSKSGGSDPIVMAELGMSIAKARADYVKSRQDFEDYQRNQKLTVSAAEVEDVRIRFWGPFLSLIKNMPMELASMCPHEMRDTISSVANDFLCNRVQPQADRLIANLEGIVSPP